MIHTHTCTHNNPSPLQTSNQHKETYSKRKCLPAKSPSHTWKQCVVKLVKQESELFLNCCFATAGVPVWNIHYTQGQSKVRKKIKLGGASCTFSETYAHCQSPPVITQIYCRAKRSIKDKTVKIGLRKVSQLNSLRFHDRTKWTSTIYKSCIYTKLFIYTYI